MSDQTAQPTSRGTVNVHDQIMNHRCIRKYREDPLPESDLRQILEAAIHAPTSANGQQLAVIVIRDKQRRERIAQLCSEQHWIAKAPVFLVFVADFSIIARSLEEQGLEFGNAASIDNTMMGAVDAGIALANSINVAQSLGYGIVPIGAIRRHPREVIEMLNLPKYAYPVVGLCVGTPAHTSATKPRLPYERWVHEETYQPLPQAQLDEYDEVVRQYLVERTGNAQSPTWTRGAVQKYVSVYHPETLEMLREQGFANEI